MKKIIYYVLIVTVICGSVVGFWVWQKYFKKEKPNYNVVQVTTGSLMELVKARGEVSANKDYNLEFSYQGIVKNIFVKEGQLVKANDKLMELETNELNLEKQKINSQISQSQSSYQTSQAQLDQAKAGLASQQARLDEMKKGTRPEEIKLAQTTYDNAKNTVNDARESYENTKSLNEQELSKSNKTVEDAQANLDDTKSKAVTDLNALYNSVKDLIPDSYSKANDAIYKQTDNMFTNPSSYSPNLKFVTDSQKESDSEIGRLNSGMALANIKKDVDNMPSTQEGLDQVLDRTKTNLTTIRNLMLSLGEAVNSSLGLDPTTLANYKSYADMGLNQVNSAISAVNSKKDAIASMKQNNQNAINAATNQLSSAKKSYTLQQTVNNNNLKLAQAKINETENALRASLDQLNLKKAGATSEQINGQIALVQQAQANVAAQESQVKVTASNILFNQAQLASLEDKIKKSILIAPDIARVTKINLEKGEVFNPGKVAVILTAVDNKIQSNISELDIGKIREKNQSPVAIKFDAFEDKIFTGNILSIDPQEIIKDGDKFYKINISIKPQDPEVRIGMSADLQINVAQKDNILKIPEVAVNKRDNKSYVKIIEGETLKEIEIKTGISDGEDIEVIQGLQLDQKIAISAD